jgi:molecular chaperone DnaK (HSP70)
LQAIHSALQAADLTASQVEEILLVGGATRTPMIRRRLLEVFGRDPRGEVDADLCVALGAAIQGAAIGGTDVSAVLVDVTPYTFGTSAIGELNGDLYPYQYVPIIARNTAIPVRKSEAFFTAVDDQTAVDVRIYQGENADALENIKIGEFRIEGLSKAPAGNPVVLDLALDRDGILHVAAREKNTGLERRISIDQAVARYGAAELQQARERIGSLFGEDDSETATDRAAAGAGDAEVARLLEKAGARLDTAGDEDRQEMIDLMETIRDAQAAEDAATLAQARTQLSDLLFYLET